MTEDDRLTRLMEQLVALGSIDEQRALYDTLAPEDQRVMDERGLQKMWRSRRAQEAWARRRKADSSSGFQEARKVEGNWTPLSNEERKKLWQEQTPVRSLFQQLADEKRAERRRGGSWRDSDGTGAGR